MGYVQKSKFIFDCASCPTPCNGVSKGIYLFNNDVAFSEHYEAIIINRINQYTGYHAFKSTENAYPDITIENKEGKVCRYIEVKVQQRTFMGIQKHLPQSGLYPSETVALNLSDLQRYFDQEHRTGISTSIIWVLLNRPCILGTGTPQYFYQRLNTLKQIYATRQMDRRFKRQSGQGDVVEGVHKGVTVNYHFSLNELLQWKF